MNSDAFQVIRYVDMEAMANGKCPCCGDKFGDDMRPELTAQCHTGPVFVSYWGGRLYLECGTCRKPIGRVMVDKG